MPMPFNVVGSDNDVMTVIDHGLRLVKHAMDLNRINENFIEVT